VRAQLGAKVDFILDGGSSSVGVESTVVELTPKEGLILRPGGVTLEQLQQTLPHLVWSLAANIKAHPKSPGQLDSHYSPHKRLELVESIDQKPEIELEKALFIGFDQKSPLPYAGQVLLAPDGNLGHAAAAFFETLHEAESSPYENLVAVLVPETGLGRAINDRLRRAAFKRG
jgi:L-threonylcarbamoyladenylate synthase